MSTNPQKAIQRVIGDCKRYLYEYEDWVNIYCLNRNYKDTLIEPLNDFLEGTSYQYREEDNAIFVFNTVHKTVLIFEPIQNIERGPYTAVVKGHTGNMIIHMEQDDENCFFKREGSSSFTIDPVHGLTR